MKKENIMELVDAYAAAAESYGIAQGNFSQDEKAKAAEMAEARTAVLDALSQQTSRAHASDSAVHNSNHMPAWDEMSEADRADWTRRHPTPLPGNPMTNLQLAAENQRLRTALKFYADGDHFVLADADAWDTVSGEPPNFYEDDSNTATVEDGSVAKAALEPGAPGQIAKVADLVPTGVIEKLWRLKIGGCDCMTKTPELRFHDERCTYRLVSEITDLLASTSA